MNQGTDTGLLDLYRRVGALEESDRSNKVALSQLGRSVRHIEQAQIKQAVAVEEINSKLAFVDKLEDFLMKADAVATFAAKVGKYATTVAKVAGVVALVATAYATGGLDAVLAVAGQVLATLAGA